MVVNWDYSVTYNKVFWSDNVFYLKIQLNCLTLISLLGFTIHIHYVVITEIVSFVCWKYRIKATELSIYIYMPSGGTFVISHWFNSLWRITVGSHFQNNLCQHTCSTQIIYKLSLYVTNLVFYCKIRSASFCVKLQCWLQLILYIVCEGSSCQSEPRLCDIHQLLVKGYYHLCQRIGFHWILLKCHNKLGFSLYISFIFLDNCTYSKQIWFSITIC